MYSKFKKPVIILIVLLLAFIWGNSAVSGTTSSAESGRIGELVRPFLELFVGRGNVTDHLVRKLAHFTEYAALGGAFALLLAVYEKRKLFYKSYAFLCGMAAAVIDEGIQLFADGRGAQVQDVLLDTSGVLFGLTVISVFVFLIIRLKDKKIKQGE